MQSELSAAENIADHDEQAAWCRKRSYSSTHAARMAHQRASYRIRTYWCPLCHAYHVTNHEKRHSGHEARP